MIVGNLVRYQYKFLNGEELVWIGIVTEIGHPDGKLYFRVQWNHGVLDWRHPSDLEVLSESR